METRKAILQNGRTFPRTQVGQVIPITFQYKIQGPEPLAVDTPRDWHLLTQNARLSHSFLFTKGETEAQSGRFQWYGCLLKILLFWPPLQGLYVPYDTSGFSFCSWARLGTAVVLGIQGHAWQMW